MDTLKKCTNCKKWYLWKLLFESVLVKVVNEDKILYKNLRLQKLSYKSPIDYKVLAVLVLLQFLIEIYLLDALWNLSSFFQCLGYIYKQT
jgi:hypothetical protein